MHAYSFSPHLKIIQRVFICILGLFGPRTALSSDFIVLVQSPHYYGVMDSAAAAQDLQTLRKRAQSMGHQLVIVSPRHFSDVIHQILDKIPPNATLRAVMFQGHGKEGIYRYSDQDFLDAHDLAQMLIQILQQRTVAPLLQVYLGSCFSACESQSGVTLNRQLAMELWQLGFPLDESGTVSVVGHLSTSEQGRYGFWNKILEYILKTQVTAPIRKATLDLSRKIEVNPLFLELGPLAFGLLSPLTTQIGVHESIAIDGYISGISLALIQRLAALLESQRVEEFRITKSGTQVSRGSVSQFLFDQNSSLRSCKTSLEHSDSDQGSEF